MIGRLLQSAASTFSQPATSRPHPTLESVTEESHTRDLLYPDLQALRASLQNEAALGTTRPSTARDAANYDDRGALDIAYPGDVRVLIAQDAHSRQHQPQMLYDSMPVRSSSSSSPLESESPSVQRPSLRQNKSAASPTTNSPRHRSTQSGSFFSTLSPTSPRSPADRNRFASSERTRTSSQAQEAIDNETAQGKLAREAKEDTDALLGCMFGAPGFRLEPGTKLHLLPRKAIDVDANNAGKRASASGQQAPPTSFQRKRTPLVRSTSAADVSMANALNDSLESRSAGNRPSIMFTRLFTVTVTDAVNGNDAAENANATLSGANSNGLADEASNMTHAQVKQKKVPMYAIAVILQLPPENFHRLRTSQSPYGISPAGSSLTDTPATSWRGENSAFATFMEIRSHGPFDTILNSHMPHVLQHWNIVNRALELLELSAREKLVVLLEKAVPLPQLTPTPSPKPGITKLKKPKAQSQQSVYVMPNCLQNDATIKRTVESAGQRIVVALRTRRVVVGQGRWGAWREEARWVGRWAGGKEQNFFLFNFLTAFLGQHTEWLEMLAPKWYRKRNALQQRIRGNKNSAVMSRRTVVVSTDKMAARRLIFLLAHFFPGYLNHHQAMVPAKETHPVIYSESPPYSTIARDSASRRPGHQKSSLGRKSGNEIGGHLRSVSFSIAGEGESYAAGQPTTSQPRRDSDARSLKSTPLAVQSGDAGSRKASMSTVTAETVEAVPHFSSIAIDDPESPVGERKRPGSGGSMASFALSHTLKRSESTAGSTAGSGGRWGSVVSGFWSSRRDSSTDDSDVFITPESPRKQVFSRHEHRGSLTGLDRMVEEAEILRQSPTQPSLLSGSPRRPLHLDECLKPRHPALQEGNSAARNIPRPRKPERLPLKLSFNEDEGYIDVAMDKEHSFSSSLASSFTSIRHPVVAPFSSTTHEHKSPYGSIASDSPHTQPRSEPALDVAGWLKMYQPDFVLQAVRAYEGLATEVEASMVAEAGLVLSTIAPEKQTIEPSDRWAEVSTTLVADTTRFTIERVRLLRRPRRSSPRGSSSESSVKKHPSLNQHPLWETRLVTEPVMDLDPMLTDAAERIINLSGSTSRSSSPPRAAAAAAQGQPIPTAAGAAAGRVESAKAPEASTGLLPTECRRAILGALEDVTRSVVAEWERERERVSAFLPMTTPTPTQERTSTSNSTPVRTPSADADNTLRDGVRRWLRDVEIGWASVAPAAGM